MLKLNIGCGWECMDGWINADNTQKWQREQYPIQFMDATIPWDYKEETFDYIYSAHMIEHIPEEKGLFALKEAYRCLKKGGLIRITCPSRTFAEEIAGNDSHPFVKNYCEKIFKRPLFEGAGSYISNRTLNEQGHVWVPTIDELVQQLKNAGFTNAYSCEYGISTYNELNGICLTDGVREYESITVEGVK